MPTNFVVTTGVAFPILGSVMVKTIVETDQTREIFVQKKLAPISRLVLDNRVLNPDNRFYCRVLECFRFGFVESESNQGDFCAEKNCAYFQVSVGQSGFESG